MSERTRPPSPSAPSSPAVEFHRGVIALTGIGRPGQVGEAVADAFAARGAELILVDRAPERVEDHARRIRGGGGGAHGFACDLTDATQVAELVRAVDGIAPHGIRALVHLAGGFAETGPVAELDLPVWDHLFAINVTTAVVTCRAFLPLLRAGRGSIVFFSSASALPGASAARASAYVAAKTAVLSLMRAVAAEEREYGVRANALAPQAIRTASNLRSMGADYRYVEREAIAEWVLWLCSAAAGPVTGQAIRVG